MNEWLDRVQRLRVWSRDGQRAPHKPLLLLVMLSRLQAGHTGSVAYVDLEKPLSQLLRDFGPARASVHPEFPFHHLASDGLWQIFDATGGDARALGTAVGRLRQAGAVGKLEPAFEQALISDSQLLASIARALLDANFPPSLHPELLLRLGLALEPVEVADDVGRRRDPAFRNAVLVAYEYRCAMCGFHGWLGGEVIGLDAAHVRWWAINGPDTVENALCLCALHHRLFDRGVLGISGDRTVEVSQLLVGRADSSRAQVLDLVGRPLLTPQLPHAGIADRHRSWHSREVFRSPARISA